MAAHTRIVDSASNGCPHFCTTFRLVDKKMAEIWRPHFQMKIWYCSMYTVTFKYWWVKMSHNSMLTIWRYMIFVQFVNYPSCITYHQLFINSFPPWVSCSNLWRTWSPRWMPRPLTLCVVSNPMWVRSQPSLGRTTSSLNSDTQGLWRLSVFVNRVTQWESSLESFWKGKVPSFTFSYHSGLL